MDHFSVSTSAVPDGARVLGFVGTEGLSELYDFRIVLAVEGGAGAFVDLSDAPGSRATLELAVDQLEPRFCFHGLVSELEILGETRARTLFGLRLVPALATLEASLHSRVFTHKSLPQILATVLEEGGFSSDDYELRLRDAYPVEEHVTQYRESDYAFLSRWMEREGLYYFFEHGERSEKLVIVDDPAAHARFSSKPVRFTASGADALRGAGLTQASLRHALRPGVLTVADYDYTRPAMEMRSKAAVWDQAVVSEVHHGERFFDPAQGARLARIRAEAHRAASNVLRAAGARKHLRSGYLFDLVEHPRAELDGGYLVQRVRHFGCEDQGSPELEAFLPELRRSRTVSSRAAGAELPIYELELEAGPAELPYRRPRSTPWPRVHGFENGRVDGRASSDYAQIDDHGRYAVRLMFDENKSDAGQSSTWVRMAQPHGGSGEGFHFPLRKDTEVLVEFLDGDPDRPIIAAVLPNAAQSSPVTAKNHTKNVIQTGGSSRIEIEDAGGGQYMHSSVPVQSTSLWMGTDATSAGGHNTEVVSQGSGGLSFGTYFDREVGGKKTERVVDTVLRAYDATSQILVASDVVQTYQSTQHRAVIGPVVRTVVGALSDTVQGAVAQTLAATLQQSVGGEVAESFTVLHSLNVGGTQSIVVTGAGDHTHENGLSLTVSGGLSSHTATAGHALEVVTDAKMHATANFSIRGDATAQLASPDTTVKGDATVDVYGGATVELVAPAIAVNGSALIQATSPKIDILGGVVHVSGIQLAMAAGGTMKLSSDGNLTAKGTTVSLQGGPLVDVHAGVIQLNLTPASAASGLGPEFDAILANDPILAARLRLLLNAGWTLEWGVAGIDPAQKIIVLDRALLHDPAGALAQFDEITGAPAGVNSLLGMSPELLATFTGNQKSERDGRRHKNACGAYAGTSLYMLHGGVNGTLPPGDFYDHLGHVMPQIANNDPLQWGISHVLPPFAGTSMGSNGAWMPGSVAGGLGSLGVPATSGDGLTRDQLQAKIDNNEATMVAYHPGGSSPGPVDGHWGTAVGYDDGGVYITPNSAVARDDDHSQPPPAQRVDYFTWEEFEQRQDLHGVANVLVPDGSYVSVPLLG
jgi:type VI secretion system secreted protein VgrG